MNRPQPRKSSLSGSSPIAPASTTPAAVTPAATTPAPARPATVTPAQPTPAAVTPAAPMPSEPSTGEKPARGKYPPKVSFYQDRADTDRIRGAILNTIPYEGVRTLSQFLSAAAMKEVERLEQQYNGGKPFPPVSPGGLPQGRPLGGDS